MERIQELVTASCSECVNINLNSNKNKKKVLLFICQQILLIFICQILERWFCLKMRAVFSVWSACANGSASADGSADHSKPAFSPQSPRPLRFVSFFSRTVAQVVRQGPRRRFIHLRRAAQLSARLCGTALRRRTWIWRRSTRSWPRSTGRSVTSSAHCSKLAPFGFLLRFSLLACVVSPTHGRQISVWLLQFR
jgi:hypothetical protein